jgi:hypothetical protein
MKAMIHTLAIVATSFVMMAAPAHAESCRDASDTSPRHAGLPVCKPEGTVPEPSSPLLFLAAASVAGLVLRMRKK